MPKPLLPLSGRPIIEHIVAGLRTAGIRDFVVISGYRGDQLEAHLGDGARFDARISYRRQAQADGTARSLLLARHALDHRPFVVSWGDIIIDPGEYAALLGDFAEQPCDALLSLNAIDDPWRGAAVYVDEHWRVTRLIEKPPRGASQTRWNNAGVFVFTPAIFTYAESLVPSARGEYELPQALAAMIDDGRFVRAHPLQGFWSDLGTPDDLAVAERRFNPEHRP